MRIAPCELTIDHVGYDGDQSHKYPRNLTLLRKQIAVDPERIYLRWHLGTVLHAIGDVAEARASFEEGIRLSEQTDIETSTVEACLCYVDLAKLLAEQGEDILPLLRGAICRFPDNHLLRWMEATTRLDRGDVAGAQPVLEALADIDPDTVVDGMSYDRRIFGAPNYAALGTAAFRAGAFSQSAAWYRRAEAKDGGSAEYRTKRLLAEARAARSNDLATASGSHPRS
jgi:tetratricopeptide (TPR) repeat protein